MQAHLINAFRLYGLPARMTMGAVGDEPDAYTGLEIWIMRQGVRVSSRPYHPQTPRASWKDSMHDQGGL